MLVAYGVSAEPSQENLEGCDRHDWHGPNAWRNNPWANAVPLQRAEAVKDAFRFAWNGYFEFAFPNDELHPVNNSFGNSRYGLAQKEC